MKLKIQLTIVYPDDPPNDTRSYATRNEKDCYEQHLEVDESAVKDRLQKIIKAFNNFD